MALRLQVVAPGPAEPLAVDEPDLPGDPAVGLELRDVVVDLVPLARAVAGRHVHPKGLADLGDRGRVLVVADRAGGIDLVVPVRVGEQVEHDCSGRADLSGHPDAGVGHALSKAAARPAHRDAHAPPATGLALGRCGPVTWTVGTCDRASQPTTTEWRATPASDVVHRTHPGPAETPPAARATPGRAEGVQVSPQSTSDFGPDLVEVFGPSQRDGGPELVQLLTPEGERVEHPKFRFEPGGGADEAETIRGFSRDMVLTRRIDTESTALQRHGELGIWAQLLGQEAAQIGSGRALRPQDYVFPTYREHGVAWCRGLDPLRLLGLFRGVDQGSWNPYENNFGNYTIVIGAQTLHATGYAMGIQRDGAVGTGDPERDAAVVGYFGDGASSQGDVNEAFIFAASYNAPVVFFCQNNQWAISEPIERQSRIPLYQRAQGFGFPGVRVDGNDVLATYAVTRAA